jgi:hypothetical protein
MNLKTRLAKLETSHTATNKTVTYICFHGVCGDGSEPELLGYTTTSRGKETRIMRLAGESVDDFQCRCKEIVPIPESAGVVWLWSIYR